MRVLSRVVKAVLVLLGIYVTLDVLRRLFRRLFPFPAPPVVSRLLDTPGHELSHSLHDTLERIGLKPGLRVLEVGAGPGYYTIEAARLLGPDGRLTSVDAQPQLVALVQEKVQGAGLDNVESKVADAKRLPFPDGTFDLAYLITALGPLPDKCRSLREIRRVLKPNGRLSITETMADPNYVLMAQVVGWAQMVGFEMVEQQGNALLYTLSFRSLFGP